MSLNLSTIDERIAAEVIAEVRKSYPVLALLLEASLTLRGT